jgi:elongation factor Ts
LFILFLCCSSEQTTDADRKKPKEILEKIIQGKVNKRLNEVCLLDQSHVAEEGNPMISKFLQQQSQALGAQIKIKDFDLWTLNA